MGYWSGGGFAVAVTFLCTSSMFSETARRTETLWWFELLRRYGYVSPRTLKLPEESAVLGALVHVTFFLGSWRVANDSSAAHRHRPVIQLFTCDMTILSEPHCVQYVTTTQASAVSIGSFLSHHLQRGAPPSEAACVKQGCGICFISSVLKWRDYQNSCDFVLISNMLSLFDFKYL